MQSESVHANDPADSARIPDDEDAPSIVTCTGAAAGPEAFMVTTRKDGEP